MASGSNYSSGTDCICPLIKHKSLISHGESPAVKARFPNSHNAFLHACSTCSNRLIRSIQFVKWTSSHFQLDDSQVKIKYGALLKFDFSPYVHWWSGSINEDAVWLKYVQQLSLFHCSGIVIKKKSLMTKTCWWFSSEFFTCSSFQLSFPVFVVKHLFILYWGFQTIQMSTHINV